MLISSWITVSTLPLNCAPHQTDQIYFATCRSTQVIDICKLLREVTYFKTITLCQKKKKKLLESSRLESTIMKCSTILRVVFLVNQRPSKSIQGLEKISNANKTTRKDLKISCKYVYSR